MQYIECVVDGRQHITIPAYGASTASRYRDQRVQNIHANIYKRWQGMTDQQRVQNQLTCHQ